MAKILIVDDDSAIREGYAEYLTSQGFEVDTAADGKVGYEKMAAGGFDVVLLDIMMPQIDGIGVMQMIAGQKKTGKNGHIFINTEIPNDPEVKNTLALGAKAVFSKPNVDPQKLAAYLKAVVDGGASAQIDPVQAAAAVVAPAEPVAEEPAQTAEEAAENMKVSAPDQPDAQRKNKADTKAEEASESGEGEAQEAPEKSK